MKLVFDIGGMSTKYCIFNNENKIDFKNTIDYQDQFINGLQLLEKIQSVINELTTKYQFETICISSPGVVDSQTGKISGLSAIIDYEKINFKESLILKTSIPIYIENDANCAALAEVMFNSDIKNQVNNIVVFVIGTGIGGGLILNNKIFKGSFNGAAEFGCLIESLDNNQVVNVSQNSSTYSIINRYEKLTGTKKTGKEIFDLYSQDKNATQAIDEMIFCLAKSMINVSFIFDPQSIVVAGAISQNDLFFKMLENKIQELIVLSGNQMKFLLKRSIFENDANLYGALSLSF